jgi:amidase
MTELHYRPAHELADMIRRQEISAVELLDHHLDRQARLDGPINAVVWQDADAARDAAHEADQILAEGAEVGPLHGVPGTVKEAFDLAGSPSTWGSVDLKDNIAPLDSVVVQRYRDAGAVLYGKTNVPLKLIEWQSFNEVYGTTNNPWDTTRTPGGSSGGSAAALACGFAAVEAGSDIGSSIRNPAHYSGVFGLKPTWGIIPQLGHMPPGWLGDFDIGVMGPLARSAKDLGLFLDVLAGPDDFSNVAWKLDLPADSRRDLKDFRVALKFSDPNCDVDQAYVDALHRFADQLVKAGATVKEAEPELDTDRLNEVYFMLLRAAMSPGITDEAIDGWRKDMETLEGSKNLRMLRSRVEGNSMRHSLWLELNSERRHFRRAFDAFFKDWDILLTPVTAGPAFPHDQKGERWERRLTINGKDVAETDQLFWAGYSGVVHLPSTVGPMDNIGGLPVGYQATTGYGRDRTAIAFSEAVELAFGGFTPPPGF